MARKTYKVSRKKHAGVKGMTVSFSGRDAAVRYLVRKYGTLSTARANGFEISKIKKRSR